jgi:3-oxoacyl-ACP reductase-like protein
VDAMKKVKSRKPPRMVVFSAAEDGTIARKPVNRSPVRKPAAAAASGADLDDEQIAISNLSLHDLFAQQTSKMLERADLTEEQKQSLMIGMSCPCCGAGGFSFTAKLRR